MPSAFRDIVTRKPAVLDVFSIEYQQDPYSILRELQAQAPILYRQDVGDWLVLHHKNVRQLINDHHRLKSTHPQVESPLSPHALPETAVGALRSETSLFWKLSVPNIDPPAHTRVRRALQHPFDQHFLTSVTDFVTSRAETLLASAAFRRESAIDLAQTYTKPLLNQMIAHLFGVPFSLAGRLGDAALDLALAHDMEPTRESMARADQALLRFYTYFKATLPQMSQSGTPFVQGFIRACDERNLTHDELLANLVLFYMVSQTTSQDLINSALFHLLQDTALRDHVTAAPSLIPKLVTETLRYESPVQYVVRRPHEPIELLGETIAAGERIVLMVAAAHHDPDVFRNPHRFDIYRNTTSQQILSFGAGVHHCMGAHAAPAVAGIVIEKLLEFYPRIRLDPAHEPRWQKQFLLRGLETLPVLV